MTLVVMSPITHPLKCFCISIHETNVTLLTVEPGNGGKEVASRSNFGDSKEGFESLAEA